MRRAQEVDVGLFHQPDVLFVGGVIDISASPGMVVVAVHASQLHVAAIDLEDLTDTLHTLDAEVVVKVFHKGSFVVDEFYAEGVEIGLLCRPEARLVEEVCELEACRVACNKSFQCAFNCLAIELQDGLQVLCRLSAGVAEGDVGRYAGLREVLAGHGCHTIVGDVHQRTRPKLYAAKDARKPPHVLVFEVASVAPSIHLHGQSVAAFMQKTGHVELGRRHGVLAVAHFPAVQPYIHGRVNTAEMKNQILGKHLPRHVEGGHV